MELRTGPAGVRAPSGGAAPSIRNGSFPRVAHHRTHVDACCPLCAESCEMASRGRVVVVVYLRTQQQVSR